MTPPIASTGRRTLTAREVADELGVVERTVRRWIESGELKAEKISGAFAIDVEEARAVFERTRAGRVAARSTQLAELRGRYLEVCERLETVERELERERSRANRLEAVLYVPREASVRGVA